MLQHQAPVLVLCLCSIMPVSRTLDKSRCKGNCHISNLSSRVISSMHGAAALLVIQMQPKMPVVASLAC